MQVTTKKPLSEAQLRVLLGAQSRVQQLQAGLQSEQVRLDEVLFLISDAIGLDLSKGRVELLPNTRELAVTVDVPDPVAPAPQE